MKISKMIAALRLLKEREGDVELIISDQTENYNEGNALVFRGSLTFDRIPENDDRDEIVVLYPSTIESVEDCSIH